MSADTSGFAAELTGLVKDLAKSFDDPSSEKLAELWSQMVDLGLTTIGLPEEAGGSGGDLGDLVVVIRELGRAGLATPIVESSTAVYALGAVGSADVVETVVVAEGLDIGAAEVSANLGLVPFANPEGSIVIVGADGVRAADLGAPGSTVDVAVDIAGLPTGFVTLTDVPTRACSVDRDAVLERLALARAASLLGFAQGAYELTRNHTCEREQFGAPLIKLPAVSSALAQLTVGIQQARAALDHAVEVSTDRDASDLRRFGAVVSARVICASTATVVAKGAHQLHGALGVTREYPLHRYTTALWASRDADLSELEWSERLGAECRRHDERELWEQLTV